MSGTLDRRLLTSKVPATFDSTSDTNERRFRARRVSEGIWDAPSLTRRARKKPRVGQSLNLGREQYKCTSPRYRFARLFGRPTVISFEKVMFSFRTCSFLLDMFVSSGHVCFFWTCSFLLGRGLSLCARRNSYNQNVLGRSSASLLGRHSHRLFARQHLRVAVFLAVEEAVEAMAFEDEQES